MKRELSLILSFILIVSMFGFMSAAQGDGNGSDANVNGPENSECPQLAPMAPDFCLDGVIVQTRNENGCQLAPRCVTREQIQEHIQEQNRIRINGSAPEGCQAQGSVVQCQLEEGRTLRVRAGNSGNTIYQVQGASMSTQVALYKGDDGMFYGQFRNNQTKAINYLPDQIQQLIQERIRAHVNGTENITLNEDGVYQVQAQKRARLFGFIPIRETTRLQIDPETGETLRQSNSWWGFLASDTSA